MSEKLILDATAGGRMMWFDKQHPNVVFNDLRVEPEGLIPEQPAFHVSPDTVADFRDLPFPDGSFRLVVFDPPHATVSEDSIIGKKYGSLEDHWENIVPPGLRECWRVLADFGVLVFKWNEVSVSLPDVLRRVEMKPLFGHTTAKSGRTKWVVFMKIPDGVGE